MEWVVLVSVLVLTILSLLRLNVVLALIAAGIVAGVMSGLSFVDTIDLLVSGMGGQANTALSYILLGAFAIAISYTGITGFLVNFVINKLSGKRATILLVIAGIACLSQNAIPVHIAFIPILIPPLLKLFNKMRIDRRAVATALTFGLKAPYVMLPLGFGAIFHGIIVDGLAESGIELTAWDTAFAMLIPGLGMVVGLFVAIFITYRKERDPVKGSGGSGTINVEAIGEEDLTFNKKHLFTIFAIVAALVVQIITQNLILGALAGLLVMFAFLVVPYRNLDKIMADGIGLMGMIAFIMLVASGYGTVLRETGAVDALVEASAGFIGDNQAVIAFILLLVGLLVTMGIGSSFGTIPILVALYVPICVAAGFSPLAIATLIGTAGALGDAGSPASDSTLGPTSGLNADGNHNHIWDTVVPTFIHYNIPLIIFGWIAAMIL
ncbi:Na+/H+ antiporter family protein [Oceanobacillus indicireducens]|uniref:Sodium:proton antiporter n=1 Tax=Oceanobacillus indicireducens TaxID=1004261 RepID=A0A917XUL6_9BACI|nr:Na+/H+ antiporter NhaC family protein [Oceanobacillus indicireducens]GGN53986.1 sodium:proton antiporter [Oceanobacillus indicireducens]